MVEYGIDMPGPVCLADSERVLVPEVPSILNDTQVSLLHSLVDPLEPCDDCGKGYYITARQIVRDSITGVRFLFSYRLHFFLIMFFNEKLCHLL